MKEVEVTRGIVIKFNRIMRTFCFYDYLQHFDEKIGGHGFILEIDKSIIRSRKYRNTDEIRDVTKMKIFMTIVPNRYSETLLKAVRQFVLPGTTIMSDNWKGYSQLLEAGNVNKQVNHSVEYVSSVDPLVHTSHTENNWHHFRNFISKSYLLLSTFNTTVHQIVEEGMKDVEDLEIQINRRDKLIWKICVKAHTQELLNDIEEYDLIPQTINGNDEEEFEFDQIDSLIQDEEFEQINMIQSIQDKEIEIIELSDDDIDTEVSSMIKDDTKKRM
ncbi:MAG: hypothetical protein EZS28_018436 [Streblomastix strix]|uniref:ISXO2-like transposase domain-containing protein n=1 Tax=Streblomastix strix TaxID=222440 RepID=A0A5J4VTY2_9EUKA|nr:MAG: hypothetical protein EZS28_018436 [Streblomastix strix]